MKIIQRVLLLTFVTATVSATGQVATAPLQPEAVTFYQKAINSIQPRHTAWIKKTTREAIRNNMDQQAITQAANKYGNTSGLTSMGIEGLIALVMIQIAGDVYVEIKTMMETMEEQRKRKEAIREGLALIKERERTKTVIPRYEFDSLNTLKNDPPPKVQKLSTVQRADTAKKVINMKMVSKSETQVLKTGLEKKLDSMNKVSESSSFRLQMLMDARIQALNFLSSVMKKLSQVQDSIVQNLK